ncbi:Uncharacterized protein dnm_002190 [Desulfonema magnum]|uniref:Uncharacterized protein n=1 Tax=Desulfonema magnum TaxID=45655 RepID=A0A975GK78_9BACT|nr:Uncharacterized protein dnm_002190 [Desulfonema magnum]
MLFRRRKNIIFALRIRSELPKSTALPCKGAYLETGSQAEYGNE